MSLPSRKTRRRQKRIFNPKILLIILSLFIFNICLLVLNNRSLLIFILPLSVAYFLYLVFKTRKRILFLNLTLLTIVYFSYLEFSFRIWAQK